MFREGKKGDNFRPHFYWDTPSSGPTWAPAGSVPAGAGGRGHRKKSGCTVGTAATVSADPRLEPPRHATQGHKKKKKKRDCGWRRLQKLREEGDDSWTPSPSGVPSSADGPRRGETRSQACAGFVAGLHRGPTADGVGGDWCGTVPTEQVVKATSLRVLPPVLLVTLVHMLKQHSTPALAVPVFVLHLLLDV